MKFPRIKANGHLHICGARPMGKWSGLQVSIHPSPPVQKSRVPPGVNNGMHPAHMDDSDRHQSIQAMKKAYSTYFVTNFEDGQSLLLDSRGPAVTVIIGPNNAGKTRLLNTLARQAAPVVEFPRAEPESVFVRNCLKDSETPFSEVMGFSARRGHGVPWHHHTEIPPAVVTLVKDTRHMGAPPALSDEEKYLLHMVLGWDPQQRRLAVDVFLRQFNRRVYFTDGGIFVTESAARSDNIDNSQFVKLSTMGAVKHRSFVGNCVRIGEVGRDADFFGPRVAVLCCCTRAARAARVLHGGRAQNAQAANASHR